MSAFVITHSKTQGLNPSFARPIDRHLPSILHAPSVCRLNRFQGSLLERVDSTSQFYTKPYRIPSTAAAEGFSAALGITLVTGQSHLEFSVEPFVFSSGPGWHDSKFSRNHQNAAQPNRHLRPDSRVMLRRNRRNRHRVPEEPGHRGGLPRPWPEDLVGPELPRATHEVHLPGGPILPARHRPAGDKARGRRCSCRPARSGFRNVNEPVSDVDSVTGPNAPIRPVLCVVGARPNFMKMAPILGAFARHRPRIPSLLVHTGQHYDQFMSDQLFRDLGLQLPDLNLEVGSGSHAVQTAEVMKRFEPVLDQHHPSCVLVVGDVNSTLACSLVAAKKGFPVVHVEAGLRSFDRRMPEEVNRVLTDQIADRLYTTERSALANLLREGVPAERVMFAGNVMIDSLLAHAHLARRVDTEFAAEARGYAVATLHRPSNVDDSNTLHSLLETLRAVSDQLPIRFVLHPRTRRQIDLFELRGVLEGARIALLPPQGYHEMLGLMRGATVVLTDSGGLQEETTALGVPCLTIRENTERPITVEQGTNTLVGTHPVAILAGVDAILRGEGKRGRVPELWDGHAAERIAADLWKWLVSISA